jgi:hypothetical protein
VRGSSGEVSSRTLLTILEGMAACGACGSLWRLWQPVALVAACGASAKGDTSTCTGK